MSKSVDVTLLVKPGCHLCDDARAMVARVHSEMQARGIEMHVEEVDILGDPQLARLHSEDIPVVLIGGRRHSIWHVDHARFTAAIEQAAKRRFRG